MLILLAAALDISHVFMQTNIILQGQKNSSASKCFHLISCINKMYAKSFFEHTALYSEKASGHHRLVATFAALAKQL